jgi:hypothetical protein
MITLATLSAKLHDTSPFFPGKVLTPGQMGREKEKAHASNETQALAHRNDVLPL